MVWTLESVSPQCVDEGDVDVTTTFTPQSQRQMLPHSLVRPGLQQPITQSSFANGTRP